MKDDVRNAVTAFMPCVGQLDPESTIQLTDEFMDERAAATRAVRQGRRPDLALLQQVLDGLQRL